MTQTCGLPAIIFGLSGQQLLLRQAGDGADGVKALDRKNALGAYDLGVGGRRYTGCAPILQAGFLRAPEDNLPGGTVPWRRPCTSTLRVPTSLIRLTGSDKKMTDLASLPVFS